MTYWSRVPGQGPGERFSNFINSLPCDTAIEKKITQDWKSKREHSNYFPFGKRFLLHQKCTCCTESVNHSVKQTITDCILVILLTIWETEKPFWLKHWLWFMNSQKIVQLNKSRMGSILKIFPKSPPLPLCWKAGKSFIAVEGCKERLSPCSWDVPAMQIHYVTVFKEDRKQNAT